MGYDICELCEDKFKCTNRSWTENRQHFISCNICHYYYILLQPDGTDEALDTLTLIKRWN